MKTLRLPLLVALCFTLSSSSIARADDCSDALVAETCLPLVRAEPTGAALDQLKARASYTSRPATTTISNKKGVNG